MKMLGIWVDSLLRWDLHVDKTVKKCRSLSYAMRFLNKFLNIKEMRTVFLSHFVGRLMYGSPVWFLGTSLAQKQAIRLVFYKQIRIILRDFRFNLDRISLTRNLNVLSLDQLMFKRVSGYLFGIVSNQSPTILYAILLSKAHYNDRSGRVVFFRDSRSRTSKSSIVTMAHSVVQKWQFKWLELSAESFKSKLLEITKLSFNPFQ